jgi:hypothetical protein
MSNITPSSRVTSRSNLLLDAESRKTYRQDIKQQNGSFHKLHLVPASPADENISPNKGIDPKESDENEMSLLLLKVCFVMFCYVLLCFVMFCYVLLCFILKNNISFINVQ